ncbi:MAG: hypothetical protein HW383_121 [Candidatus Magasanikbacteria bacterium]|nr:hypothetical protein [Candidatus Magasanikbacteria bacterium]
MDIFAHGLWSNIVFTRFRKRDRWLAIFFGIAPDLFSFGLQFLFELPNVVGRLVRKFDPRTFVVPSYVHVAYNLTHSLFVFILLLILFSILRRNHLARLRPGARHQWREYFFWPFLSWGLHILIDIPTHAEVFFPTPFLFPLTTPYVNGISWGTPVFMLANYGLIVLTLIILIMFWRKKTISESKSRLAGLFIALVLALSVFAFFYRVRLRDAFDDLRKQVAVPTAELFTDVTKESPPPEINSVVASVSTPTVGTQKNLAVPFTSQAPFANWDPVHEETCEEASLIMVDAYFKGTKSLTKVSAEDALLKLVAWQKTRFGYFEDTTAEETAIIAREYFGYKNVSVAPLTLDAIERSVARGVPVIVPANGKMLGNPNFRNGGPEYHMLVIKGFTKDKFITNDPGTRKGENYLYDKNVVLNAAHDWVPPEKKASGAKVMIIIAGS